MKLKKIAVTTDFSDLSRQAFPAASSIARRFGAELHLLHVLESPPPVLYFTPTGAQAYSPDADYRLKYKELLARTAGDPSWGGAAVKPHLLEGGHFHDRLVQFQKHQAVDLTVIATHGRTGLGHLFLGSFAERAVRLSLSPVLVHRPSRVEEFAPKRILVPVDLSHNALAALEPARFLAEAYGARVLLLHVIAPLPDLAMLAVEGIALYGEERRTKEAPRQAKARLDEIVGRDLGGLPQVDAVAAFGSPFQDIPRFAQSFEADLMVMATHGWTGLNHVLLGSVTERMVQKAACPVLTVRPVDAVPEGR